ncbi:hypothetical protein KY285_023218 [Solanum tuberosum]|nr:hypothetical protein KY285_023218 [Solanum tuberosum]
MAQECGAVIGAIDLLKGTHLDSSIINQLDNARTRLVCVSVFMAKLEEVFPENTISTQLGALFQQAHDGFSEICTYMDQRYTINMTKELNIIKLNNIAERLEAASKPSISTRDMNPRILVKESKLQSHLAKSLLWRCRCIEHESMQYFFIHIENVAYTALRLHFQWMDEYADLEYELHSLINSFSPDLRQIYKNLLTALKSSRSETTLKSGCMLDFVNPLREDLEVHLHPGQIWGLKEELLNSFQFLQYIEYGGTQLRIFSSLQSLIEGLALEAALVINAYDEDLRFVLQPKLNHVNVVIKLIQQRNSKAILLRADSLQLIDYALEELIVVYIHTLFE